MNLKSVDHIDKRLRSYEISLDGGLFHLPISRDRVPEVLPQLEDTLGLKRAYGMK